eukprot:TRINITY_DN1057_c0_g1_i1.p1 TRINITY_DN1057_c0_g1~~TRINITY_DN1057_c0_g1_i1.p1  ORF type:complete len:985 (+),score=315.05 TRINITY_DN1057_c0_g1_i1:1916-4870(+)
MNFASPNFRRCLRTGLSPLQHPLIGSLRRHCRSGPMSTSEEMFTMFEGLIATSPVVRGIVKEEADAWATAGPAALWEMVDGMLKSLKEETGKTWTSDEIQELGRECIDKWAIEQNESKETQLVGVAEKLTKTGKSAIDSIRTMIKEGLDLLKKEVGKGKEDLQNIVGDNKGNTQEMLVQFSEELKDAFVDWSKEAKGEGVGNVLAEHSDGINLVAQCSVREFLTEQRKGLTEQARELVATKTKELASQAARTALASSSADLQTTAQDTVKRVLSDTSAGLIKNVTFDIVSSEMHTTSNLLKASAEATVLGELRVAAQAAAGSALHDAEQDIMAALKTSTRQMVRDNMTQVAAQAGSEALMEYRERNIDESVRKLLEGIEMHKMVQESMQGGVVNAGQLAEVRRDAVEARNVMVRKEVLQVAEEVQAKCAEDIKSKVKEAVGQGLSESITTESRKALHDIPVEELIAATVGEEVAKTQDDETFKSVTASIMQALLPSISYKVDLAVLQQVEAASVDTVNKVKAQACVLVSEKTKELASEAAHTSLRASLTGLRTTAQNAVKHMINDTSSNLIKNATFDVISSEIHTTSTLLKASSEAIVLNELRAAAQVAADDALRDAEQDIMAALKTSTRQMVKDNTAQVAAQVGSEALREYRMRTANEGAQKMLEGIEVRKMVEEGLQGGVVGTEQLAEVRRDAAEARDTLIRKEVLRASETAKKAVEERIRETARVEANMGLAGVVNVEVAQCVEMMVARLVGECRDMVRDTVEAEVRHAVGEEGFAEAAENLRRTCSSKVGDTVTHIVNETVTHHTDQVVEEILNDIKIETTKVIGASKDSLRTADLKALLPEYIKKWIAGNTKYIAGVVLPIVMNSVEALLESKSQQRATRPDGALEQLRDHILSTVTDMLDNKADESLVRSLLDDKIDATKVINELMRLENSKANRLEARELLDKKANLADVIRKLNDRPLKSEVYAWIEDIRRDLAVT